MSAPPARARDQRKHDALDRLENEVPADLGDAFADRTGFDPRTLTTPYAYRVHPRRVQAWRESNELDGRLLMRDGTWLV
ncbi:hypothetical protein [Actinophytocola sp.]|uniref:hypothetical protein n=1 Tax=Actinophytocola sp. TaxID=1872138 RepID=UPI0025C718E0|nr:hypothetical protein [Actinophytocola sp.]